MEYIKGQSVQAQCLRSWWKHKIHQQYEIKAHRQTDSVLSVFLDSGVRRTWQRLLDGHCGIVNVVSRDERFKDIPSQIAAVVPPGKKEDGGWTVSEWMNRGVSRDLPTSRAPVIL